MTINTFVNIIILAPLNSPAELLQDECGGKILR